MDTETPPTEVSGASGEESAEARTLCVTGLPLRRWASAQQAPTTATSHSLAAVVSNHALDAAIVARDGRQVGDLGKTREANQDVDDARDNVRLTEIEADQRGDEIELERANEQPVQRADDDERERQDIQTLGHSVLLAYINLKLRFMRF